MELMIVMSIIGILASALYPSFKWYLFRTHSVENFVTQKDWTALMTQYIADNDGLIPSSTAQTSSSPELYYISSGATSGWISWIEIHTWLSTYFQARAEWKKLFKNQEKFLGMRDWWYFSTFLIHKASPLYWNSVGTIFPGISPLSTTKITSVSWIIEASDLSIPLGDTNIQWSSLGKEYDKRCSPWIAANIYGDPSPVYNTISCSYIF